MTRVFPVLMLVAVLTASRVPAAAPVVGAIRGRVEVKVEKSLRDARPDPGGLGMGSPARDPQERRRSVVFLDEVPVKAFEQGETRRVQMVQKNERFIPHVLAVVAGTVVDFPNADSTYHNVFSLSKTQQFNLGRYAAGKSHSVRFDNVGVVRVFCDIHSQMSAFIVVLRHRYFAVTDDDGRYRIGDVPPGTYDLLVWNETLRGDPAKRSITIPDSGGDVEADFVLK